MMQIAQLIGGAGTGKTRALLEIMDGVVKRIHDPHLVGFVSFTRAACDEAADRAADLFNRPRAEFRQHGWFRTIHGIAHRCLGIGEELLTDRSADRKWIEAALQTEIDGTGANSDGERLDAFDGQQTEAGIALAIWHAARNRLEPIARLVALAEECDSRAPDLAACLRIIDRYEQAKRLDGRIDFVDLLLKFSGWQVHHTDGAYRCDPDGEPPKLTAWIHDEMQDSSRLLDACFRRLIDQDATEWVYLAGDPYQAIYGWSGSDHRIFSDGYPIAKRKVMPKSWRCPSEILRMGEEVLRDCSDYWDRGIEPAGPGGEIDQAGLNNGWAEEVDPRESWLLLARTNYQAARMARRLDDLGVPWLPTKKHAGNRWKAPIRAAAIKALRNLEEGAPIDGSEWQAVLKHLPAKADGATLLERGTKTRFEQIDAADAQQLHSWVTLDTLAEIGGTPALADLIRSRTWRGLVEDADKYLTAIEQWGQEAVESPKVRVGTIHSAKGLEADHVALLTTISGPVCIAANASQEGHDEEARTKYVGLTRAKQRLIFVQERTAKYRWRLP